MNIKLIIFRMSYSTYMSETIYYILQLKTQQIFDALNNQRVMRNIIRSVLHKIYLHVFHTIISQFFNPLSCIMYYADISWQNFIME